MPFYTATTIVRHGGKSAVMSETALSEKDAAEHLALSIRFKVRDASVDITRVCSPWPPVIAIST